jgi:hypothetical protein
MRTACRVDGLVLAGAIVLFVSSGCRSKPDPIQVHGTRIAVENQTSGEWRDVEVWVNHHYRATAKTLAAGGRLDIPVRLLVTGFGQPFDPVRQRVSGIEVTARSAAGDVRLVWGEGRKR